jgi:uncharacterized protein YegP (UPF0339 family)
MNKFEVKKDKRGEWRWNLRSNNSKIVAVSEGYKTKQGCLNGIRSVKRIASDASVIGEDGIKRYFV